MTGGSAADRYERAAELAGLIGRTRRTPHALGDPARPARPATRSMPSSSPATPPHARRHSRLLDDQVDQPAAAAWAPPTATLRRLLGACAAWGIAPDAPARPGRAARGRGPARAATAARPGSRPHRTGPPPSCPARPSSTPRQRSSARPARSASPPHTGADIPSLQPAAGLDEQWLTVVAAVRPRWPGWRPSSSPASSSPAGQPPGDPWQTDPQDPRPLVAVYADAALDLSAPSPLSRSPPWTGSRRSYRHADQAPAPRSASTPRQARAQQAILLAVPPVDGRAARPRHAGADPRRDPRTRARPDGPPGRPGRAVLGPRADLPAAGHRRGRHPAGGSQMIFDVLLRLEPDPYQRDLARGWAAELADPAWMLGRQWQMGEHQGEDASSPVGVELRSRATPIGPVAGQPGLDPATVPAQAIIESEPGDWWTAGRRVRTRPRRRRRGRSARRDAARVGHAHRPARPLRPSTAPARTAARCGSGAPRSASTTAGSASPARRRTSRLTSGIPPSSPTPRTPRRRRPRSRSSGMTAATWTGTTPTPPPPWARPPRTAVRIDARTAALPQRAAAALVADRGRPGLHRRARARPGRARDPRAHRPDRQPLRRLVHLHPARPRRPDHHAGRRDRDRLLRRHLAARRAAGTGACSPPAASDPSSIVLWATARTPLAGPVLDQVVIGIDEDANLVWAVEQVVAGRTLADPRPAARSRQPCRATPPSRRPSPTCR